MNSSFRFEIILFFVLTLIAEILGTLGGFGSSMFFVPISQFFFDFQTVLALTAIFHVFSNVSKIVLFRKWVDWKVVLWLGISSIVFVVLGALLTRVVAGIIASFFLGVFLTLFSVYLFFNPSFSISPTPRNSIVSGGLAGFLAGFIGTGGAIRGLALSSFNLEKNLFVGTSAMIDFGVDLSRAIVYIDSDYLDRSRLIYLPILFIAAAVGSYLGKIFLQKIQQERFRQITLILVFITGVTLVLQQVVLFLKV